MPSMLDTSASGVYIIAATPFTDEGAVDSASLDRLMDFYLGCGITGVTVLGIMATFQVLGSAKSASMDPMTPTVALFGRSGRGEKCARKSSNVPSTR